VDHSHSADAADNTFDRERDMLMHNLRTPLTVAILQVHLLRRRLRRDESLGEPGAELDRIADALSEVIAALAAIEESDRPAH
jgi:signal transduction histidine kinase